MLILCLKYAGVCKCMCTYIYMHVKGREKNFLIAEKPSDEVLIRIF